MIIYKTIKQVAEMTGLSASNIRYYESEGLIQPIKRNNTGIRMFTNTDITWISFLKRLKDMEMPIIKMKEYAQLRANGATKTIEPRIELLLEQKLALKRKMALIKDEIVLIDDKISYYKKLMEENNE